MKNNAPVGFEYLIPKRIVLAENCIQPELLLKKAPRQAMLGKTETMIFERDGFVVLDFGREIHGGLNITVYGKDDGAKLRLTFGESVSEALSSIGEKGATNDHALRDYECELAYSYHNFETGNTGFRFVKVAAVGGKVVIGGIQAKFVYRNLEYIGSFECSDDELNEIWKTGAYTVQLNMQEYVWDGIKRDRLIWIGDMHPEVSTALSVFGEADVLRDSLDAVMNCTPIGEWANGIPSYSMWWIVLQRDWYMSTGDKAYIENNRHYIFALLTQIISCINADGNLCFGNNGEMSKLFVDWSSNETEYMETGFRGVLSIALSAGAELCEALGNTELQKKICDSLRYVGKFTSKYEGNKQTAALAALGGFIDAETASKIIKKDGAKGFSTFMGYYSLLTLSEAGEMSTALEIIKQFWGGMIKMGATAFWEEFDISDMENSFGIDELPEPGKRDVHGDFGEFCYKGLRKSLCHGWASGPTAFLSRKVLGVVPLEPGYKRIKVCPNPGALEWVKGKIPTPYGVVCVEYDREKGTKIIAPDEIIVEKG
ncbi:MAG: family 78 glycoside hydrolase catalytic domain [Clostridiales bacterium]|nr:family 78 glycoside hydrolase catalytic domain [Clostridiales bacterium]